MGNLEARRDWGHARDYVRAMQLMLQAEVPRDFVIATGQTHTVRELCQQAFGVLDLDWEQYVRTDPAFVRPAEVDHLVGDASLAAEVLGWTPEVGFGDLVKEMVLVDLERAKAGLQPSASHAL